MRYHFRETVYGRREIHEIHVVEVVANCEGEVVDAAILLRICNDLCVDPQKLFTVVELPARFRLVRRNTRP